MSRSVVLFGAHLKAETSNVSKGWTPAATGCPDGQTGVRQNDYIHCHFMAGRWDKKKGL